MAREPAPAVSHGAGRAAGRRMRILTVSSLYPNGETPAHGVFVENRLRELVKSGEIEATVVAPVPWFPFGARLFGRYGKMARVLPHETRHGLSVEHPRFLVIPKLGMSLSPFLYYLALRRHARRALRDGREFDLIDAHYVYPDGVAAAWLGAALNKPVVLTARGSDLNLVSEYSIPRRLISGTLRRCAAVVAVSRALADRARALGGPKPRIEVHRNGVDLDRFRETDRGGMRQELMMTGPVLICVGHLISLKGYDLVIEALARLPKAQLLICGEGPMLAQLQSTAQRLGLAERVRFLGAVEHDELGRYYSAADVLVMASSREGWPNVLLEAMACGTPVVATAVGAVPEFVDHPHAGRIVHERTPEAIAAAVQAVLDDPPSRRDVRAYATRFSWDDTTRGLENLFRDVIDAHANRSAAKEPVNQA